MNTTRMCPSCGMAMPSDAPEGLCPQCLLNPDTATKPATELENRESKIANPTSPSSVVRSAWAGWWSRRDPVLVNTVKTGLLLVYLISLFMFFSYRSTESTTGFHAEMPIIMVAIAVTVAALPLIVELVKTKPH